MTDWLTASRSTGLSYGGTANVLHNEFYEEYLRVYTELIQRDKANLDIFWLKDESLEDTENLPAPEIIAAEITENLQNALEQFNNITEELEKQS